MLSIILLVFPCVLARLDLTPVAEPPIILCNEPSCQEVSQLDEDPHIQFPCNGSVWSVHPDPKDCHSYYECLEGNATKLTCPLGYGFNDVWGFCALEYTVRSCNIITCPFVYAVFPDQKNCTRFYMCLNGYPFHYQCPNGTVYHPVRRLCFAVPQGVDLPCLHKEPDLNHTTTAAPDVPTTLAPDSNSTSNSSSTDSKNTTNYGLESTTDLHSETTLKSITT